MDPEKLSDARSLQEMRNEVKALTKLNHIHVIRYYGMETEGNCHSRWCNHQYCGCLELDADEDGICVKCEHPADMHAATAETRQTVSIVQELAAGGDLVSLLFTASLGYRMDDVIPRSYFHQLIDGIEYCHSQRICHGDIKPENLCLDADAVLKIVDFGLCHEIGTSARVGIGAGSGGHSGGGGGSSGRCCRGSSSGGGSGWSSGGSNGSAINSGCYTAPEIAQGRKHDRQAADIWSCGVVLYNMVERSEPFEQSDSPGPRSMQDGTFAWPDTMGEDLRNLIRHMLDPEPATRYNIAQIMEDPWYRQHVLPQQDLTRLMTDHMSRTWFEQDKQVMVDLLQTPQKVPLEPSLAAASPGQPLAGYEARLIADEPAPQEAEAPAPQGAGAPAPLRPVVRAELPEEAQFRDRDESGEDDSEQSGEEQATGEEAESVEEAESIRAATAGIALGAKPPDPRIANAPAPAPVGREGEAGRPAAGEAGAEMCASPTGDMASDTLEVAAGAAAREPGQLPMRKPLGARSRAEAVAGGGSGAGKRKQMKLLSDTVSLPQLLEKECAFS
jgi:serine/threonine protein kinase